MTDLTDVISHNGRTQTLINKETISSTTPYILSKYHDCNQCQQVCFLFLHAYAQATTLSTKCQISMLEISFRWVLFSRQLKHSSTIVIKRRRCLIDDLVDAKGNLNLEQQNNNYDYFYDKITVCETDQSNKQIPRHQNTISTLNRIADSLNTLYNDGNF